MRVKAFANPSRKGRQTDATETAHDQPDGPDTSTDVGVITPVVTVGHVPTITGVAHG